MTIQALDVRRIKNDEYSLREVIGQGCIVNISSLQAVNGNRLIAASGARLTIKYPDTGSSLLLESDVLSVNSGHGTCQFTNGRKLLGLLAGIPLPLDEESSLSRLFDEICLQRVGQTWFSSVGPLELCKTIVNESHVRMNLTVHRGDTSAFSTAKAHPEFWRAMTVNSTRLQFDNHLVESRLRRLKTEIGLPLDIARGRFAASALTKLSRGDVLLFKKLDWRVDNKGEVCIANRRFECSILHEQDGYYLRLNATTPTSLPRQIEEMTTSAMNTSEEHDEITDDEGFEQLDRTSEEIESPYSPPIAANLIDVRNVELEIVAEIGRIKMSIDNLDKLHSGSILKITSDASRTVTLRVAGNAIDADQTVAFGELVQVGETLAVQILRVLE